jgi:hypothetical protein
MTAFPSARVVVLLALPLLLWAEPLPGQSPADCSAMPASPPPGDGARIRTALGPRAVRAERLRATAPAIDGRLTDEAWCGAAPAGDFVQSRPAPGALATLPSSARVLYDDDAVYVGVRLADPHPDSIEAPYPRRDDEVTSDWVFVELDTRFDRRSGFSFGLNPRGVQVDGTWWDDVTYDPAWNGVWQGAALVDSLGWTAEFRIPFAQLALGRSAAGADLTWGINIYRTAPHRGETSNWSPRLPTVTGVVSRFNLLQGLTAPPHGARVELVPYGAVTGVRNPLGASDGVMTRLGADIRVRPTRSTSLLLSLHPDFGQVEADPSQVNLTTFETFLPEQRPLFVEGADVFQFGAALPFASRGTSFAQERPFYSRRIGRAPQVGMPSDLRSRDLPAATTVLGAARFSARTSTGWSGGVFHAWTDAEHGNATDSVGRRRSVLLEPLTSYSVARAVRESGDGAASAGVMATVVDRLGLSARADSQLPRRAFVIGSDARWRRRGYELTGFVLGSRVEGSPPAITLLRNEPRHGYNRSAGLRSSVPPPDTAHQALTGLAAQARLARLEGRLQWSVAGRAVTQGFESNDVGFQRNANWLLVAADWQYQVFRPGRWLRRWSIGSSSLGVGWTTAGERRAGVANLRLAGDFRSYWGGSLSLGHEFPAIDPEVLRGGPALLLPARDRWALSLYSDTRRASQFTVDLTAEREPGSGSYRLSAAPGVSAFVTDRLQLGIIPEVSWGREGWQYVGQPADSAGRPHYLLGKLDQRTVSLTTRVTYAFSPHLTLQGYAQAFVGSGQYPGFAEVKAPRARRPAGRVVEVSPERLERDPVTGQYRLDMGSDTTVTFADPAFADRELHLNLLLRWEFLPGSTLFLVWTQERSDQAVGPFRLGRDLGRLRRAAPTDALQLKVSYWLAP